MFIYVPDHVEVHGNERADSLASSQSHWQAGTMGQADIMNSIRNTVRIRDSGDKLESTPLAQLIDFGVIRGDVKNTCYLRHS